MALTSTYEMYTAMLILAHNTAHYIRDHLFPRLLPALGLYNKTISSQRDGFFRLPSRVSITKLSRDIPINL